MFETSYKEGNQVSGAVMGTTCRIAGGSLSYNFVFAVLFVLAILFALTLVFVFVNKFAMQFVFEIVFVFPFVFVFCICSWWDNN